MRYNSIAQILLIALCYVRGSALTFPDNNYGSLRRRMVVDSSGITGLVLMYTGVVPSVPVVNLSLDAINVIDLTALSLPDAKFSIKAMIASDSKSVVFSNGQYETAAPLAYCGNSGQLFFTCPDLVLDSNVTVSASAYSERYGAGNVMSTRSVTLRIIQSSTTVDPPITMTTSTPLQKSTVAPVHVPTLAPVQKQTFAPIAYNSGVTEVRLMYTGVDPSVPVMNLSFDVINVVDLRLLSIQEAKFSLDALISSDSKSVIFSNGQCETSPPLAYCGNYGKTFFTCPDLTVGANLTITVTAYSERSGGGVIISTRKLPIQIIRSTSSSSPTEAPTIKAFQTPQAQIRTPTTTSTKMPTKTPTKFPTTALSKKPTNVPSKAPTRNPTAIVTRRPTKVPTRRPTNAPIRSPTKAPSKNPTNYAPTNKPITVATMAPVHVPTVSSQRCNVPRLTGEWGSFWSGATIPYPIHVAEAQGAMIGNDFVITSGFKDGYISATPETYALDMYTIGATWRRMDDMPFPIGLTHLGVAVKGMTAYFCGGYIGGALGTHNASCFQYDHSIAPGKGQWKSFAPLPDGGRSGGGMIYDSTVDALFYAAGSQRPNSGVNGAYDFHDTFMYSLKNPGAGWVRKTDIPFTGNHMNFVTAFDENGKERHYFFGGQHGDHEETGNTDEMIEYNAVTDTWIKRKNIPYPLGHAAATARAIGCGFIVAGGRLNTGLTADITYYDIPTNTWTKIGELPHQIHTNVCVVADGNLRCETGWAISEFSWTRPIEA